MEWIVQVYNTSLSNDEMLPCPKVLESTEKKKDERTIEYYRVSLCSYLFVLRLYSYVLVCVNYLFLGTYTIFVAADGDPTVSFARVSQNASPCRVSVSNSNYIYIYIHICDNLVRS